MFTAVIDEDKCIGCSRCIPACPVDAIIGAPKKMHTVLTSECIGCKLCLNPCPMDCIDIVDLAVQKEVVTPELDISKEELAKNAKLKYKNKQIRINKKALPPYGSLEEKKAFIKNDLERIKNKNKDLNKI